MKTAIISKDVAERIVEAGAKLRRVETQTIRKPEPSAQPAFDASIFRFNEVLEFQTETSLKNELGETLFFGGDCDVYQKEWNDLDDAIRCYTRTPLTLNGYALSRIAVDSTARRDDSTKKFCPFAGTILTSERSATAQENTFQSVNPLFGKAKAPGELFLGYSVANSFKANLYDSQKNPRYRWFSRDFLVSRWTPCNPALASAVLVAVPPFAKWADFTKAGRGTLFVFMRVASANVPKVFAKCVDANGTIRTFREGANQENAFAGWHGDITLDESEYDRGTLARPSINDVFLVDLSFDKPKIVA